MIWPVCLLTEFIPSPCLHAQYCDYAGAFTCAASPPSTLKSPPPLSPPPPPLSSPPPPIPVRSPSPSPVPSPRQSPPASLSPVPTPSPSACPTNLATFCTNQPNKLFVDRCDPTCSAYIQCWNGVATRQVCPSVTPLFSETKQYCDYAGSFVCTPSPPSISSPPSPLSPPPPPTPSPKPAASPSPPSPSPSSSPTPSPSPSPTQSPSPTPSTGVLFSAYKDIGISMNWNTFVISTEVTGSFIPVSQAMPTDMSVLTWAFATGECGSENWAGMKPADVAGANVPLMLAAGKRYIISTGGAGGAFTCGSDAGFNAFLATYDSPNFVGVDFDIEVGQSQAEIAAIMQRVKTALIAHPRLRFSFTVATNGAAGGNQLGETGVVVMQAIKAAGLANSVYINLMAMDYGTGASVCAMKGSLCDMGRSAINAAESLHSYWGVPYALIEITPMIGGNDVITNVFTLADASTVSAYVLSKGLGGVHYWSLDRDNDCAPGYASSTCNSYGSAGVMGFGKAFLAALGQ